jgi:hypothetical protein
VCICISKLKFLTHTSIISSIPDPFLVSHNIISLQEVVETINEFAFVASDYPVILSIENHCRKYPHLLQRMATIFKMVFGEKLMGSPLDDFPVRRGRDRGGERDRREIGQRESV